MYHRLVGWLIKKIIDRWCQNQHEKDDDAQQLSVDCRKYDIFVEEKRKKKAIKNRNPTKIGPFISTSKGILTRQFRN